MNRLTDRFPGVMSDEIAAYLSTNDLLFSTSDAVGTPFHVVFPRAIRENICAFRQVFSDVGVEGEIFYAAKANKSGVALEIASRDQVGVDAASLYEQQAALSHGTLGKNIRLSGPEKDLRAMVLALQHGSSIAIDSLSELATFVALSKRVDATGAHRILLRISADTSRATRFGLTRSEIQEAYRLIKGASLQIEGFTFHLDGYSLEERAHASFAALNEMTRAEEFGFSPRVLSIGGGFGVAYVEEPTWETFQLRRTDPDLSFGGQVFTSFYPYFSKYPSDKGLREILNAGSDAHQVTLAQELQRRRIQLHIEPGRSLLDQSGITVLGVLGVKRNASNDFLVQVDGNINHLSEQWFNTDYLPDPILLCRGPSERRDFRASVAGNTCMERDLVTWRKVHFDAVPRRGDLLVYLNTAGYVMDSNESTFHRLPIPEKVAAYRDSADVWKWTRDSRFSHLDLEVPISTQTI